MSESAINAPKGLLRLIILDIASKNPVSGAEISKHIKLVSNSMWTPSPGSIYPILNNLQKSECLTEIYSTDSNQKKYGATSKGKSILAIEKEKDIFCRKIGHVKLKNIPEPKLLYIRISV